MCGFALDDETGALLLSRAYLEMFGKWGPFVVLESLTFNHYLLPFRLNPRKGEDLCFEDDGFFIGIANDVVELLFSPLNLYFERGHFYTWVFRIKIQ